MAVAARDRCTESTQVPILMQLGADHEGMEPFAVDGRVDLEQMHALLDAQAEYATLDYEQTCNLSDKKARAEFVKSRTPR